MKWHCTPEWGLKLQSWGYGTIWVIGDDIGNLNSWPVPTSEKLRHQQLRALTQHVNTFGVQFELELEIGYIYIYTTNWASNPMVVPVYPKTSSQLPQVHYEKNMSCPSNQMNFNFPLNHDFNLSSTLLVCNIPILEIFHSPKSHLKS